ncbi:hypothetical protein Tco_0932636 [Tanacetum coccineum]
MAVVHFHCSFVGLSGCQDGGGNGITKTSSDLHTFVIVIAMAMHKLSQDNLCLLILLFLKRLSKGSDFVSPPDCGDGVVRFVLYDLTKPHVPSSSEQLDHVDDLVMSNMKVLSGLERSTDKVLHTDDISCWVSLLVLPLCLLKTFFLRSNLEYKSAIKRQRQEESIVNAIRSWSLPGDSLQLMRETLAESSPPFSDVDGEDIDLGERNLKHYKRKICDGHYTAAV